MSCTDFDQWQIKEVVGKGADLGKKGFIIVGPGTIEYLRKHGSNQRIQPFLHLDTAQNALRIAHISFEAGVERALTSQSDTVVKNFWRKLHGK